MFSCKSLLRLTLGLIILIWLVCGDDTTGTCDSNLACNELENAGTLAEKLYSDKCNIPKVGKISQEEFLVNYAFSKPVIIVNATDNTYFRFLCSKDKLLEDYGDKIITLSTANTHSYDKVNVTFAEYIKRMFGPQNYNKSGQETLYFFGNHDYSEWKDLFKHYILPPYELPGKSAALSFGIAGIGTGVPFHFHGPGFAEVITGQKRWFLSPYNKKPTFNPNKTTLRWLMEEYSSNIEANEQFYECVLQPGELLYFPNKWWHATLNTQDAVFMSTFLS